MIIPHTMRQLTILIDVTGKYEIIIFRVGISLHKSLADTSCSRKEVNEGNRLFALKEFIF